MTARQIRRWLGAALLGGCLPAGPAGQDGPRPTAALDRAEAAAEGALSSGDFEAAERHYRVALFEGWLLMSAIERSAGRLPEARQALATASGVLPPERGAVLALASAQLQVGEAASAEATLTAQGTTLTGDTEALRLLARALSEKGDFERAARRLDEAVAAAGEDMAVVFALAIDYLWLKRADAAERLFARVVERSPGAGARVLIGRAYRDAGEYGRARRELERALELEPRVRRAHYYLGTVAMSDPTAGPDRIQTAIAEFGKELELESEDPLVLDQLGLALLEAGRPSEALPAFERAARADPRVTYFNHLARGQLAAGLPAEAVTSLRRALELSSKQNGGNPELETIHYRLGMALRRLGPGHEQEAAVHFAEARRLAARWSRIGSASAYPESAPVAGSQEIGAVAQSAGAAPVSLGTPQRKELEERVRASLARSNLNLGVMQLRAEQFARAVELFERAAAVAPEFPGLNQALGFARFNMGKFAGAIEPLSRALAEDPGNSLARRLLAMALINVEEYTRAADLLEDDPDLTTNPALQMALGLALATGDRAPEAEEIFTRLLRDQGESAPVLVALSQAQASQRKLDRANASVSRALAIDPLVAGAGTAVGLIHYQGGQPGLAEDSLRAEMAAHPEAMATRRLLAAVLITQGRFDEAIPLLRAIIDTWPDSAPARYMLGKALLVRGGAPEAVEHLEAAVRRSPDDPNARLELGRAYKALGKAQLAEAQFQIHRQLMSRR